MLTITIPEQEFYDESTETFVKKETITLQLEHSLLSLSKWESKVGKPFLAPGQKSKTEVMTYVFSMILTPDVPESIMLRFTEENYAAVVAYIDSPQSATTFQDLTQEKNSKRTEIITSELIYYWMTVANIPFSCETWHLNRLFALIRIHNIKNSKDKKLSKSSKAAMIQQRNALNAQRKAQMNSTG